jgi:hypothetical protein
MSEEGVEQALRRIEELITALDAIRDPAAREPARALLEVVLDLHAVALARMTARIASSDPGLLQDLAEDEVIRGVLLLHGVHPDSVEVRVERAVESLRPRFALLGLGLKLVKSNARLARVRVRWIAAPPARLDAAALQEEIEAAIIEAAPDLETLDIEGLDETITALAD